jgi:hypothetical protein
LPENTTSQNTITDICINLITTCWFFNIILSLILVLKQLGEKIFERLKTTKVKPEAEEIEEESVTHIKKIQSYRESKTFLP